MIIFPYTTRIRVPLTSDQRGYDRTEDGDGDGTAVCDIGAFEKQDLDLPINTYTLPTK